MSSGARKVLGFVAVIGAAAIGYSALRGSAGESSKLLTGRLWIDRLPSKETDHYEAFVAIKEDPLGIFQRASKWEGGWTMFRYEIRGDDKVVLMFPQDKSKHEVRYKAWECKEKNFDFCLELDGAPRGAKRYVSRKEWEIDATDQESLEAELRALRESLPSESP
jgi:hypothetical protein